MTATTTYTDDLTLPAPSPAVRPHGTGPTGLAVAVCDEPPEFVAVTEAVIQEFRSVVVGV
jgi:hypothetical protein